MITVFYLHGFRSSPKSKKAYILQQNFNKWDIAFRVPDLNVPSFDRLTLTAQIEYVSEEIRKAAAGDIYIIASSMGALVALHFMARCDRAITARVKGMIFLAPSFDFIETLRKQYGQDELDQWKQREWMEVYHYTMRKKIKLHYRLLEDVTQYDSHAVNINTPLFIIHGNNDEEVNGSQIKLFAQGKHNVNYRFVDSDHSLTGQSEYIWSVVAQLFKICERSCVQSSVAIRIFNLTQEEECREFMPYEEAFLNILEAAYKPDFYGKETHKKRMINAYVFLAFLCEGDSEHLVGGCYYKQSGKLSALGVLPNYRRRGIGRRLVCTSLTVFNKQFAELSPENHAASQLLGDIGFMRVLNEVCVNKNLAGLATKLTSVEKAAHSFIYTRWSTTFPKTEHKFMMLDYEKKI